MKFPEYRLSMEAALPSSVHSWLGQELELRGIDSLIYTRYVISLLQHGEDLDSLDPDLDMLCKTKAEVKQLKSKKQGKKKSCINKEEKKRIAAIKCLQAVSDEPSDIETLVEELCARLEDIRASQACSSPVCEVTVVSSSGTESSEESGSELRDPAERYYAAFPALHGQDTSPSPSPSIVTVWKNNPLIKSSNEHSPTDDVFENKVSEMCQNVVNRENMTPSRKSAEKRSRDSRNVRWNEDKENVAQTQPSPVLFRSRSSSNYYKSRHDNALKPRRFHSLPSEPVESKVKKEKSNKKRSHPDSDNKSQRENENICTRVESLLKGMLLPVPDKKYKELLDVEDECPELREKILHSSSRCESVSPELQENAQWYTQPMEEIFHTSQEQQERLRLYKRSSYPSFSPSPVKMEDSEVNRCSTVSSPAVFYAGDLQFHATDEDDNVQMSPSLDECQLIPDWLCSELSDMVSSQDTCTDTDNTLEETYQNFVENLNPGGLDRRSNYVTPPPGLENVSSWFTPPCEPTFADGVSENRGLLRPPPGFFDTVRSRKWSTGDSDGEYFTPTPTSTQQQVSIKDDSMFDKDPLSSVCSSPCSTTSMSLLDMDYLSRFLDSGIVSTIPLNLDRKEEKQSAADGWNFETASQTSCWQSKVLVDQSLYKVNLDEEEAKWQRVGYEKWHTFREKGCLSQLWDVNQQKQLSPPWAAGMGLWGPGVWLSNHDLIQNQGNTLFWKDPNIQFEMEKEKNTLIPQISVDLASEEDYDADDTFSNKASYHGIKHFYDRSISLCDVPSDWRLEHPHPDPRLSRSFDLVPSEHSAFKDVVPRRLHHVQSEPNLALFRTSFPELKIEEDTGKPSSPQEHLYFSPKTHFRPITPAYAPELCTSQAKEREKLCNDLFGGYFSSKTPYQKYIGTNKNDDGDETFVPKFKLKKSDKYIQTGDSLDREQESEDEDTTKPDDINPAEMGGFDDADDNAFEREIASEILEKIDEEFDSANVDSAYETDYGISVFDTENCAKEEKEKSEEFWSEKMAPICKGTGHGLDALCSNNTLPARDCEQEVNNEHSGKDDQGSTSTHNAQHNSHKEGLFKWNVQELWGTDTESEQCDANRFSAEKYKNIWSSGQDCGMPDLSEFCVTCFSLGDPGGEDYEPYKERNHDEQALMSFGDDYFSVKIRYKDKLRIANEEEQLSDKQSYGLHDLMPMPNEALFSCELEQKWFSRELPFFDESVFINPAKSSRLQRKPCSFFMEGKCRRADCKFAHDLSNITCRFWEEGECFKGPLCPFLHGYPSESSSTTESGNKEKFVLNEEEFPDLKTVSKSVNSSGVKRSRSLRSQNSGVSASRKEKNGRKQRRHSNKETKTEAKI